MFRLGSICMEKRLGPSPQSSPRSVGRGSDATLKHAHRNTKFLKVPRSKRLIWGSVAALLLALGLVYFLTLPVAEIAVVKRGTAISAVYGTVRIEPALLVPVRAQ